ncbi:MAG: EF-hand domain-containing protein, partial [Pseudomonadota bacterium]
MEMLLRRHRLQHAQSPGEEAADKAADKAHSNPGLEALYFLIGGGQRLTLEQVTGFWIKLGLSHTEVPVPAELLALGDKEGGVVDAAALATMLRALEKESDRGVMSLVEQDARRGLAAGEVEELRAFFTSIDTDKNGRIDREEMLFVLRKKWHVYANQREA